MRKFPLVLGLFCLAFSAPTYAVDDAAAVRARIEMTLSEMERAVLKGDGAAYMANVRRDNAHFAKEQENWAADLVKHTPSAFTLSIIAPPEGVTEEFGTDAARFEMEMAWTMPGVGKDGAAVERSVSFPVLFIPDIAGERWLYAGEDWITIETPPLDETAADGRAGDARPAEPAPAPGQTPVHLRGRALCLAGYEDVAETIVGVMPEVRAHVDEGLGTRIQRVQEVKVYPSVRHLQASIYLSYVDGLSGWNEPGEAIKVLGRPGASRKSMRSLLGHEYGHVATAELGPKCSSMPWWVLEGVAELAAQDFAESWAGRQRTMSRWAAAGTLAAWADLSDFRSVPLSLHGRVYAQGHHMLGFISEQYGREKRNAWLTRMAQGDSVDAASRTALGVPFDELDRAWRASLRPDGAEPTPTPPAPPPPASPPPPPPSSTPAEGAEAKPGP